MRSRPITGLAPAERFEYHRAIGVLVAGKGVDRPPSFTHRPNQRGTGADMTLTAQEHSRLHTTTKLLPEAESDVSLRSPSNTGDKARRAGATITSTP